MRRILTVLPVLMIVFTLAALSVLENTPGYHRLLYSSLSPDGSYYLPSLQMSTFASYAELKSFLEIKLPYQGPYYGISIQSGARAFSSSFATKATEGLQFNSESSNRYSGTNIQVAGVDEADCVKTDGEFLYIVTGSSLVILDAIPAEETKIISRIELKGSIKGIFINNL